jgi:hypothetical protein
VKLPKKLVIFASVCCCAFACSSAAEIAPQLNKVMQKLKQVNPTGTDTDELEKSAVIAILEEETKLENSTLKNLIEELKQLESEETYQLIPSTPRPS